MPHSFDLPASSYQFEDAAMTDDDPLTLDDEYEQQRILSLPENLQRLAIESKQNQFDAMTPYTERFDQRPKNQ